MFKRLAHKIEAVTVETVLGLLLGVSLTVWAVPVFADRLQRKAVEDVGRRLAVLARAKESFLLAHPDAQAPPTTTDLVPKYLSRWPCSPVADCSDFFAGRPSEPVSVRAVTLSDLEDPVTQPTAIERLFKGSARRLLK